MDRVKYDAACERADAKMKEHNGHTFLTILKTRCIYCHRSPKAKGKCRGWIMTFVDLLYHELDSVQSHIDWCRYPTEECSCPEV